MALLLGLAGGKLWGYEGSILVTEGQGFCNSFQQYDTYSSGPLVKSSDLTPLCVDLDHFRAKYEQNLTAASFTADITYGPPGQAGPADDDRRQRAAAGRRRPRLRDRARLQPDVHA